MNYPPLPFTLRQLQYACAVADELSFRKAAEKCFVSQPSLSAQIKELERYLDVQLFERDRRGVRVTPAGEALITRARQILTDADDFARASEEHTDPLSGRLRIGVIPTIAPYLLPDLDPALRESFEGIDLHWSEHKTEDLVKLVNAGELDAALLALEAEIDDLEHETICTDPFVLAVSPEHELAEPDDRAKPTDLADNPVFLLEDGHCFRDQALDLCAQVGANEVGFRATSLTTLVQLVSGRGGITILPDMAIEVENRRAALTIRRFQQPEPYRTIILGWRKGSALADSLPRLAQAGREILSE
jgi:LysR family hydrogen peroxide-inducible transcriptional activator